MPNYTNIDFRLGKTFTFMERYRLELVADAFNLFNSKIVGGVNTTAYTFTTAGKAGTACATHTNDCLLPSSSFGAPTVTSGALYGARQLQVGMRFEF